MTSSRVTGYSHRLSAAARCNERYGSTTRSATMPTAMYGHCFARPDPNCADDARLRGLPVSRTTGETVGEGIAGKRKLLPSRMPNSMWALRTRSPAVCPCAIIRQHVERLFTPEKPWEAHLLRGLLEQAGVSV